LTVTVNYEYKNTNGLYYALGAGYLFKFNLFFDLTYSFYYGSFYTSDWFTGNRTPDVDTRISRFSLNIGYKFKAERR